MTTEVDVLMARIRRIEAENAALAEQLGDARCRVEELEEQLAGRPKAHELAAAFAAVTDAVISEYESRYPAPTIERCAP